MEPGGKPDIDVPGLTPRSPVTTVGPVLVTALPPRTAKVAAVPSGMGAAVAPAGTVNRSGDKRTAAARAGTARLAKRR